MRERKRKKELYNIRTHVNRLQSIIRNMKSDPNERSIQDSNKSKTLISENSCRKLINRNKRKIAAAPKIVQFTPWKVRIYWDNISEIANCTDNVVIEFWKEDEPNKIRYSKKLQVKDRNNIDIKVDPGVLYKFRKIATYKINDEHIPDSVMKGNMESDLIVKSNMVSHQTLVSQPRGIFDV